MEDDLTRLYLSPTGSDEFSASYSKIFPYGFAFHFSLLNDVLDWCRNEFGEGTRHTHRYSNENNYLEFIGAWDIYPAAIYFQNEQDALMFKMRWL